MPARHRICLPATVILASIELKRVIALHKGKYDAETDDLEILCCRKTNTMPLFEKSLSAAPSAPCGTATGTSRLVGIYTGQDGHCTQGGTPCHFRSFVRTSRGFRSTPSSTRQMRACAPEEASAAPSLPPRDATSCSVPVTRLATWTPEPPLPRPALPCPRATSSTPQAPSGTAGCTVNRTSLPAAIAPRSTWPASWETVPSHSRSFRRGSMATHPPRRWQWPWAKSAPSLRTTPTLR